jgi:hypothetical protein
MKLTNNEQRLFFEEIKKHDRNPWSITDQEDILDDSFEYGFCQCCGGHVSYDDILFLADAIARARARAAIDDPDDIDDPGYPSRNTLRRIMDWDYKDPKGWFKFIESQWSYGHPYFDIYEDKHDEDGGSVIVVMSTGGWSGNESIIAAMMLNPLWKIYWALSERGGRYVFKVAIYRWETNNDDQ